MPLSLTLRDDILAPRGAIVISYKGPNPFSVYKVIDKLFRHIFEAKGTNMNEPDFRWDTTEDPNPFFFVYQVLRRFDKWTSFIVQTKVQGAQPKDPSKASMGWVNIEISGFITTAVPIKNPFVKAIWQPFFYAYMVAYYAKVRRRYLESLRRGVETLEAEIRNFLKIPVRA